MCLFNKSLVTLSELGLIGEKCVLCNIISSTKMLRQTVTVRILEERVSTYALSSGVFYYLLMQIHAVQYYFFVYTLLVGLNFVDVNVWTSGMSWKFKICALTVICTIFELWTKRNLYSVGRSVNWEPWRAHFAQSWQGRALPFFMCTSHIKCILL